MNHNVYLSGDKGLPKGVTTHRLKTIAVGYNHLEMTASLMSNVELYSSTIENVMYLNKHCITDARGGKILGNLGKYNFCSLIPTCS